MNDRRLPDVLWAMLWIQAGLWLISLTVAVALSHPLTSFSGFRWVFFDGAAFDYFDYLDRMYYLHRPEFFTHGAYPWYYPAAGVFPLQFFYGIGRIFGCWRVGYLGYILLAISGAGFAVLQLARAMQRRGVAMESAARWLFAVGVLSWPIYFGLQRGNIEAVTWLLVASAIWAYGQERWMLAAVLLGVVAAFKLYPALCFALFLQPRRWKELAAGLAAMGAVTVAALRYLLPDIRAAALGVYAGMSRWVNDYASSYHYTGATYDHSLYELTKLVTLPLHPSYPKLLTGYLVLAGALSMAMFLGRVVRLPRTNQVVFLVCLSVFLPPASFDYTLENLYVAFGWLVLARLNRAGSGRSHGAITASLLLLAVLFAPETFLLWHGVTANGLVKGGFLMALLATSVMFPMNDFAAVER